MALKASRLGIWLMQISCVFYLLSALAFAIEGNWSATANRALISLLSGTLAAAWKRELP